jgi:DNA polymerase/3'-5' exonuclease PolX
LSGIGKKIGEKIDEIIATGKLGRLDRDKDNEELQAINELSKIPGLSAERAR